MKMTIPYNVTGKARKRQAEDGCTALKRAFLTECLDIEATDEQIGFFRFPFTTACVLRHSS